jgi:serine/threonine protein phosphatase PrpC
MRVSRDEIQTSTNQIEIGSATHVGRVRRTNEDNYRVVPARKLFVLSDGIGGQANGEVASGMAVETILIQCLQSSAKQEEAQSGISATTNRLLSAARSANRAIFEASALDRRLEGMGATLVAAWIEDLRMSLVNVGDSRVYLLRAGQLKTLTADHTLVAEQVRSGLLTQEQAKTNPLRRILIRALGAREEVEIDTSEQELRGGDSLLLCSDGLTCMVPESEILEILSHDCDAQCAADRLVAAANEHGGEDNVTVILVRIATNAGQDGS